LVEPGHGLLAGDLLDTTSWDVRVTRYREVGGARGKSRISTPQFGRAENLGETGKQILVLITGTTLHLRSQNIDPRMAESPLERGFVLDVPAFIAKGPEILEASSVEVLDIAWLGDRLVAPSSLRVH
jgi:hypothetical protein